MEVINFKWNYELQYKKDFEDNEDYVLFFSVMGNFFGKDQFFEFINIFLFDGDVFGDQFIWINFQEVEYIFKLDYIRLFFDKLILEMGVMYVVNDVSNDFVVSNLEGGDFVVDFSFINIFEYSQDVLGVYIIGAYEGEQWGIKLGMCVEYIDLKILLAIIGEFNNQNFVNFFFFLYMFYKFSDWVFVQVGYFWWIFCLRLWDFNFFFNICNNFSVCIGNFNLLLEYIDFYEVLSIYFLGLLFMNFSVYYWYIEVVVECIFVFENNVNIIMFMNIGINCIIGFEFNVKYSLKFWLIFNGDFNYNYFNWQGELEVIFFDFMGDQWFGKLIIKFKLFVYIDFEVMGQYELRV